MLSDQARWNARYLARPPGLARPQPWLLAHQSLLPPTGLAFDLAMGLGGSAGWLLERGWRAAGADISELAVRRAKARWPALLAFVIDLERVVLPAHAFDLLLDFYYLDRALWPQLRRTLRPGGLLLIETFVSQPGRTQQAMRPAYLLQPGELRAAFADWQVLDYREEEREGRAVAGIVARAGG